MYTYLGSTQFRVTTHDFYVPFVVTIPGVGGL